MAWFFCSWSRNVKQPRQRQEFAPSSFQHWHNMKFAHMDFQLAQKYMYMDVSENRGTPKSSILIGFSIINHSFWGTPIFGNTHINRLTELSSSEHHCFLHFECSCCCLVHALLDDYVLQFGWYLLYKVHLAFTSRVVTCGMLELLTIVSWRFL